MIATLPMYDWPELRSDTDAYWQILRRHFAKAGFSPPDMRQHVDDETHGWLEPGLFFSQTCGYPFISRLEGRVELLGTPHFDIDGWQGPNYSSAVIVQKDHEAQNLEQFREGSRFAFNSSNSLSGYRCMTPLVGRPEDWFGEMIKSGGHRKSADMVADGRADIAAIDALCWHLYAQIQPEQAAQLRVLQWTPSLPGLPYITNNNWTGVELQSMRFALGDAVSEMANSKHNHLLQLRGVTHLNAAKYAPIRSL
ncbi:MAG: PhnD/SsuA/transferrin family substrate-binding protein [Rhizobiaceae bacterium]